MKLVWTIVKDRSLNFGGGGVGGYNLLGDRTYCTGREKLAWCFYRYLVMALFSNVQGRDMMRAIQKLCVWLRLPRRERYFCFELREYQLIVDF